ncbi:hypothetical protein [Roseibacillus persicicus]|uniref:Uncharacterized protein n=1 Tax=Roseibacillus persicicus TaxID=454148 RepID=A0A918WFM7_9BACT|nr:hypothetical protein [Roseibacillus persicicus]GHC41652.1 hypothetical protein GCM10007100_03090 [Roseibacillus persicicus]
MEILPLELADCSRWILQRPELVVPPYSIAVDINCPACQPPVAAPLAAYLNEFSDLPTLSWKSFDPQLLGRLEKSPLAAQLKVADEDLHLTLAKMGGSILEGPGVISRTRPHPYTFQVCLACKEPENQPFHLHLNQKRFEPGKVVNVIADSFLEWVDGGGDPPSAKCEQGPASHAKPTLL